MSGVGGQTVLSKSISQKSNENFFFLGSSNSDLPERSKMPSTSLAARRLRRRKRCRKALAVVALMLTAEPPDGRSERSVRVSVRARKLRRNVARL